LAVRERKRKEAVKEIFKILEAKERDGTEKLEKRYLRWVLRVDRRTQGYLLIREATKGEIEREGGEKRMGV